MRHRNIGRFNRNFMWSVLAMALLVLLAAGMFLYLCCPPHLPRLFHRQAGRWGRSRVRIYNNVYAREANEPENRRFCLIICNFSQQSFVRSWEMRTFAVER